MSEEDDKPVEKAEKVEKTEVREEHNAHAKRRAPTWLPWAVGGAVILLL